MSHIELRKALNQAFMDNIDCDHFKCQTYSNSMCSEYITWMYVPCHLWKLKLIHNLLKRK